MTTVKFKPFTSGTQKKQNTRNARFFRRFLVAAGVDKRQAFGLSFKCAKAHADTGLNGVNRVLLDHDIRGHVISTPCYCGDPSCGFVPQSILVNGPAGAVSISY